MKAYDTGSFFVIVGVVLAADADDNNDDDDDDCGSISLCVSYRKEGDNKGT